MSDLFERTIRQVHPEGLYSEDLTALQVNVGLRCNQACSHCHLQCSPDRTEMMKWHTMQLVLDIVSGVRPSLVDITGGAPELNANLRGFIKSLKTDCHDVQVRTNLTVLFESDMETMPEFFKEYGVRLVASMPCYLKENVNAQRGAGAYEKSIMAMKRLNGLGYGVDPALPLRLVYNPGGPLLSPDQSSLEADYRRELATRFGVEFTDLITIANMPIGRFDQKLRESGQRGEYMKLLKDAFNPRTIEGLMCRHQVSIGHDGTLYDCDFNLALGIAVNHGAPDHLRDFDSAQLAKRRICTGEHCFGCTAGAGSSCGGALAAS